MKKTLLLLSLVSVTLSATFAETVWDYKKDFGKVSLEKVYTVGHDTVFVIGSNGFIARSIDTGNTWITQNVGSNSKFNDILLVDKNKGVAVGDSGLIATTTNAGSTWTTTIINKKISINAITMDGNLKLWAVGDSGKVYTSTNTGNSWQLQNLNISTKLNDISFMNGNGYIVGNANVLLKSFDNGTNWTRDDMTTNLAYNPKVLNYTAYDLISIKQSANNRHYILYGDNNTPYSNIGNGVYESNGASFVNYSQTTSGFTLLHDTLVYTVRAAMTTCGCGDVSLLIHKLNTPNEIMAVYNTSHYSTYSSNLHSDISMINDSLGYATYGNVLLKTTSLFDIQQGLQNISSNNNIIIQRNGQNIVLKSNLKSMAKIEFFDLTGKRTASITSNTNELVYNTTLLNKGIYMIYITYTDQSATVHKWIKQY